MMLSAGNGFIMQSDKYSRDNAGQSLKKYILLKKGELAYNHGASKAKQFGCCYELHEEEARIPYVYHCFKVRDTEYTPYIALELNNPKMDKQLKRLVSSSVRMDGLLNISFEDYMSVTLHLPSFIEQKHIANFLTKLDERIAYQERLITSLKKYKRGLQNRFFFKRSHLSPKASEIDSHDVEPLGSVVHINPKTGSLPEAFIYIDLECVESGVLNSKKLISRNSAPSRAQRLLEEGDLLYQMVRPYQKNNYYFQKGFEYPTVASTGYAQIRCSEMDTQFIYEQLSSDYFAREAMLRSTGTGYPAINADDLAEIPIWVPPLNQQEKIGAALSSLGEKIEVHQKLLSALCSVKFSLLQQLFI